MNAAAIKLRTLCEILVREDSGWHECKKCVEDIHDLFAHLGALDVRENATLTEAKPAMGGTAIAPSWAGLCLMDVARTRKFVAGLKNAINHFLTLQPTATVHVLDAGCGPYGLLSVLCAGYFSPLQVQFTLLDIFDENIASTKHLIHALGYEQYFTEIIVADAVCYTWPHSRPLHILVTETMNKALSKEPQVAITLNLSQYLLPEGLLIPTCINISLQRRSRQIDQNEMEGAPQDVTASRTCLENLGDVMQLHRHSVREEIQKRPISTMYLADGFNAARDTLFLITEIQIFEDVWLGSNESAITLPCQLRIPAEQHLAAAKAISFTYKMLGDPAIEWRIA
ncbi:MAG: hypothetical protein EOO03_03085 [Chitinophagaceae bacterium]|nr:MAG: hypothetical protein EOO03_03085 [Chitinophagaceae bacterium]